MMGEWLEKGVENKALKIKHIIKLNASLNKTFHKIKCIIKIKRIIKK